MKKLRNILSIFAVVLCFALCCFACTDKPEENPEPDPTPESPSVTVTLSAEKTTMDLHDSFVLSAEVKGSDEAAGWLTSDARVVTVKDGTVTAVGVGSATVSAYVGGSTAACSVNVVDSFTAPVLDVENEVSVGLGSEYVSPVSVLWKGKPVVGADWSVRLKSGEGVASVVKTDGGMGMKGIKTGEAVYTVSANVYGITLVEEVAVKVTDSDVTVVMGGGFAPVKGGFVANVSLHPTVGEQEIPLDAFVEYAGRNRSKNQRRRNYSDGRGQYGNDGVARRQ